jgi:RiboL-PSP-HEPN
MSFDSIREVQRQRFNEVNSLLEYISFHEPNLSESSNIPVSPEIEIIKGLYYVHLYGAVECSIAHLCRTVLSMISDHGYARKDFSHSFGTVASYPEIRSINDSGNKKLLANARNLFQNLESESESRLESEMFSMKLQNVRPNTIKEIIEVLGIDGFSFPNRITPLMEEIVEYRNAVAHGRESARVVGSRFRSPDLRKKTETLKEFIDGLTDTFEEFYTTKRYLKIS